MSLSTAEFQAELIEAAVDFWQLYNEKFDYGNAVENNQSFLWLDGEDADYPEYCVETGELIYSKPEVGNWGR